MAQLKGTVTRVVEGKQGQPRRVFIRPSADEETQEALKFVDGSDRLASGEVAADSDDDVQVGDETELDVRVNEDLARAHLEQQEREGKPAPRAKRRKSSEHQPTE